MSLQSQSAEGPTALSATEAAATEPRVVRRRVPLAVSALALGLWIAVLCWAGVKTFWWWRLGVGVTENPGVEAVWHLHYRELYASGAVAADVSPNDGYYDVLLLGGSVLEQTAPALERSLRSELGDRFRLFNLARVAHTSRDSYFKQQRLAGKPFDLVVLYDGINDARLNCCPEDVYRDDYRHFVWYDTLETRLEAKTISVGDILSSRLNPSNLTFEISNGRAFSDRVKTARAYRQNIESVVEATERYDGRALLMTFAYDLPPNYSIEAFRAHQLGYGVGKYTLAIEVWGTPKGVEAAILAHNAALRDIARSHKGVIFVDEEKQMPKSGTYFSDPCHLTDQGVALFGEHFQRAIHGDVERWKGQHHLVTADSNGPPAATSGRQSLSR
jgi:hypothetical protein